MATHADLPTSRRRVLAALSAAAGCGALCSCGGGYVVVVWGNVPVVSASQPSPAQPAPRPIATTYARDLVHPWGLAFLPDGTALVTERPGRMRLVGTGGRLAELRRRVFGAGDDHDLDAQTG